MIKGQHRVVIYGLRTCPVCQRAHKALKVAGREVQFRDVRAEPLSEVELAELLAEFGNRLVDRKTNDYRSLNIWLKNAEAEAQIVAQPKVMVRPIIRDQENLYLGWDTEVENALLA